MLLVLKPWCRELNDSYNSFAFCDFLVYIPGFPLDYYTSEVVRNVGGCLMSTMSWR